MDSSINEWIDTFITGYKKSIANKKNKGIMKMQEGKAPLSFQGYNTLCETFCTIQPQGRRFNADEVIFGWVYTTLSWNTMGRSHSVGGLMLQHIRWKDDCLVITFAKSKCDQTGEGLSNDKHVYANPLVPYICPVLSLAVMIFTKHRGENLNNHKLFGGLDPENRFSKILKSMLEEIPEEVNLGAPRNDLGSHSQRKGSITYFLGFSIISAVQAYLRAGWSLGNVQDRYIFGGAGGDQLVGRAVCGLPINNIDFATLPPHFRKEDLEELNQIGWTNILPDYENFPKCFQPIVPFLLASLIYHWKYLLKSFGPGNSLFNQPFSTRIFETNLGVGTIFQLFRDRILLGKNYCEDTKLQATGIPDHLSIAHEVKNLVDCVRRFEDEALPELKNAIISKIEEVPENVKSIIMENFTIEGVVPVNMSDIQRVISEAKAEILSKVSHIEINTALPQEDTVAITSTHRFDYFTWGGKIRMIPRNFIFPNSTVKTMWDLWFHGNEKEKIQPYKNLVQNIKDLEQKTTRNKVHRTNKVMMTLLKIAVEKELIDSTKDISKMTQAESDHVFDCTFPVLINICYGSNGHMRPYDIHCDTIADLIYKREKKNSFKRKRNDFEEEIEEI